MLEAPVSSSGEALLLLGNAAAEFEASYRSMLALCLKVGVPLIVCTIYHGDFPDPSYRACVAVALCAFNDAIIRVASEHALKVIDLRRICVDAADYAETLAPSSKVMKPPRWKRDAGVLAWLDSL